MNAVEAVSEQNVAKPLAPPMRLETGSIVTIKMRGHTRSPGGLEYYALAVVLNQYQNDTGDLEVLVWDSTAGTHYNPAYPVRELSSRGEGPMREVYESASNIGQVLFSPDQFRQMAFEMDTLQTEMEQKHRMITELITRVGKLEAGSANLPNTQQPTAVAGQATVAPKPLQPPVK